MNLEKNLKSQKLYEDNEENLQNNLHLRVKISRKLFKK